MKEYLNKILTTELLGQQPSGRLGMAVCVPVYDEAPATVLKLLRSLARQEYVCPDEYEVLLLVNNSSAEAKKKSRAFLANQRMLELGNYLTGSGQAQPEFLSQQEKEAIEEIKSLNLRCLFYDHSSQGKAKDFNNVGIARNWLGEEAVRRFFKSGAGLNGIIALLDAECSVSPNFINEILLTFSGIPYLNAMVGRLRLVPPPGMKYGHAVMLAVKLHLSRLKSKTTETDKIEEGRALWFQKQDHLPELLVTGQNMAVTGKAFAAAGGIPPLSSSEDRALGHKVSLLPGEICLNHNYWIEAEARPSLRTGAGSLGRRIGNIEKAVADFLESRAKRLLVPDPEATDRFISGTMDLYLNGNLNGKSMAQLVRSCGFGKHALSEKEFQEWVNIFTQEQGNTSKSRHFTESENWLVIHLNGYFPTKDVTEEFLYLANYLW